MSRIFYPASEAILEGTVTSYKLIMNQVSNITKMNGQLIYTLQAHHGVCIFMNTDGLPRANMDGMEDHELNILQTLFVALYRIITFFLQDFSECMMIHPIRRWVYIPTPGARLTYCYYNTKHVESTPMCVQGTLLRVELIQMRQRESGMDYTIWESTRRCQFWR